MKQRLKSDKLQSGQEKFMEDNTSNLACALRREEMRLPLYLPWREVETGGGNIE
jgi:hypothetical protein